MQVNIESKVAVQHVPHIVLFLDTLKTEMHAVAPGVASVLWCEPRCQYFRKCTRSTTPVATVPCVAQTPHNLRHVRRLRGRS